MHTRLASVRLASKVNKSSFKSLGTHVSLWVSTFCTAHSTLITEALVHTVTRVVCYPTKHLAAPATTVH